MALLAAYNFDEAADAAVEDVTGNGHGFPLRDGMSREPGHTASGLVSTNGSVEGPAMFGQTALRTVMFWLKSGVTFNGWIFEYHLDSGNTGLWGLLCLSGQMGFRGRNAGGTTQFASIARPNDGAWHHWAGTFDGSVVRLYLDGVLRATSGTLSGGIAANADVINWHTTVSGAQTVDDLRVYDEALDAATIADLMGTPVAAGDTDPEEHSGALELGGSGSLFYVSTPGALATRAASGTGTLTLSGRPRFGGSLGLTGSGGLATDEEPHAAGTLDRTGSGALSRGGAPSLSASLDLAGSGSLGLDGDGTQGAAGALDLSGSGSLTLSGRPSVTSSLALSGSGALALTPATDAGRDLDLSAALEPARFTTELEPPRIAAGLAPTARVRLSAALERAHLSGVVE